MTINGTNELVEQPRSLGWERQRGFYLVREWIDPAGGPALLNLHAQLTALGVDNEVFGLGHPGGSVRAFYTTPEQVDGSPEVPVNQWEVEGEEAVKDLLDSDQAAVLAIGQAGRERVRQAVDAKSGGSLTGNELELYRILNRGDVGWLVDAPVLRHTLTVSQFWQGYASQLYVRRIIRTNALITMEGVPLFTQSFMPNLSDPSPATYDGVTVYYGWLKFRPRVVQSAYNKAQITQLWKWGLWPGILYGTPVT